jgi:hypothetical protein
MVMVLAFRMLIKGIVIVFQAKAETMIVCRGVPLDLGLQHQITISEITN